MTSPPTIDSPLWSYPWLCDLNHIWFRPGSVYTTAPDWTCGRAIGSGNGHGTIHDAPCEFRTRHGASGSAGDQPRGYQLSSLFQRSWEMSRARGALGAL